MHFSRIFVIASIILTSSFLWMHETFAAPSSYTSVLQIRSYTYDPVTGAYSMYAEGSAVVVGTKRIVTNAHVILGSDDAPTGYYEVCRTISFSAQPQCFVTAKLVSYDSQVDLALLEPATSFPSSLVVPLTSTKIDLGSAVTIYGYPAIGGSTITSTSGKIAGLEDAIYKLDATIDHGNSGGGAFDNQGRLIGIPYAIRSDNGVIGYMIPIATVIQFLSGKTTDIESYSLDASDFVRYIADQKKVSITPKISNTDITLLSPKTYGFRISGGSRSKDGKLALYYFSSADNRVFVGYSCNQLYGEKTLADTQEVSFGQVWDDLGGVTPEITHIGSQNNFLQIAMNSTDATKKTGLWYYYPRSYNNCIATISATNRFTDTKNIEKAKKMITEGTTWKSGVQTTTLSDPILSQSPIRLASAFRLHKILSTYGDIYFAFWYTQENKTISAGNIRIQSVKNLKTLFGLFDENYTGSDFSFSAFEKAYAKHNTASVTDSTHTTQSGQKFILSVATEGDKKIVSLIYPFRTNTGTYRVFSLTGLELTAPTEKDIQAIVGFFSQFTFPGTPAFAR